MNTNPVLTGLPLPRPDVLAPVALDLSMGTAEIFRLPEVKAAVTSDFMVLPCDLVCELDPEKLLQAWIVKAKRPVAAIPGQRIRDRKNGGLGVWYETKTSTPIKGEETDFIALAPHITRSQKVFEDSYLPHISRVVLSMPTDSLNDLTEAKSGLPLRHGLLRKHPRVRMLHSKRDAHLYIFPRWIVDFINENPRFETLGEDVVGWWAKAEWETGLPEKLKLDKIHETETAMQAESPSPSTAQQSVNFLPIVAYLHPAEPTEPLIRRVDTSALLLAVSLQLAKLPSVEDIGAEAASPFSHPRKVAYPEGVKPRTTISKQDSLVAENVTVEEKSSIKESVVGANCQINEGAKLLQCLLMDGVVVGKACKLTRCILGKRCIIGDGSVLTDCEVQENLMVEAKSEFKPF
jgi:translation initiation factor eIF-2B subunit gamma